MPTLANSRVAPPRGWDEFEDIVCSAAKSRWSHPNFTRHGRSGQAQSGVDIYGDDDQGQLVGLQCKNTWNGVSENSIKEEVALAEAFRPSLSKLYIATTAETDKNIQLFVRELSAVRNKAGLFEVDILFWNDVWHDLTLDEKRVYQHFPHLKPKTTEPSHDLRLYTDFQLLLPFEPTIRLLREHDFGGSFHKDTIKPLYRFYEEWDQPEKEFIDDELQAALKALYVEARNLSNQLTSRTSPVGDGSSYSVFTDNMRREGRRPPSVIEDAQVLNEEASKFVPLYESFIRLCRRKLQN